jgi:hypothetical protein
MKKVTLHEECRMKDAEQGRFSAFGILHPGAVFQQPASAWLRM